MTARSGLLLAYALALGLVVVLTLTGRVRRLALVPLGAVLADVVHRRAGRVALALAWAWLGWHLLAR